MSTMDELEKQYEKLEAMVRDYSPKEDFSRMRHAFEFANSSHNGQLRKDGTPYITHPLAVAIIVAELGLDMESILASLLHDCIEDTEATHADIAKDFGVTVADLVEAITKLSKLHYTSKEELQMENLRKMFMAMAKDIRVILIKICDRLHNMRTMEYQSPVKQREKSLETMEIYAPIAHRLGMQRLKWELEDLSLRYLDPVGYGEIEQEMEQRHLLNQEFMQTAKKRISDRIGEEGIRCTLYGRVKHTYSIYRKMFAQNRTLEEIFDLFAVRVIVEDVGQCYNVLGCVHDLYKPVLGRFKDYIGTPKPNMYQSLHTTVIGRAGIPFEVQIRTWEMHQTAEYGVAAHWKYKQGIQTKELGTEHDFEWVRKLLESQQDADAEEFIHTLKVDMFADEVFVFTPEGDVKSLPARATPIDFAYSVHSEIGNHMVGAKVNGRIVSFDYQLQNGEVVEILTARTAMGPSRDWLNFARSTEARNKIRQWYKRERRGENIVTGRGQLESELKFNHLTLAQVTSPEILDKILKKLNVNTLEDVYATIGYGGTTASKIVARMKEEIHKQGEQQKQIVETTNDEVISRPSSGKHVSRGDSMETTHQSGIVIDGIDDCLVKFAKCCSPVPGDPVIGFISRGYGVSIHRKDCHNVNRDNKNKEEAARWIPVSWGDVGMPATFQTSIELSGKARDGLMLDIAVCLSEAKIKVVNLSMRAMTDGYAIATIDVEIKDKGELTNVVNKLSQLKGVYHAGRVKGK